MFNQVIPGEPADFKDEMYLDSLVDTCHKTIDWSINLYFKGLSKKAPLFVEKIIQDKKNVFSQSFHTYFLNDTEISALTNDIEEHINTEIITAQNKWLPAVKLNCNSLMISLEPIEENIKQRKITLKLIQQAEKNLCQLVAKAMSNFTPKYIPKQVLAKANAPLGKSICRTMTIDSAGYARESTLAIEQQVLTLLQIIKEDLQRGLKYQVADQLYSWFDNYYGETDFSKTQQVVNC